MNVTLIDYQKNALEILLYTKDTRLQGSQSLDDIIAWPLEKKLEHLDYMRHTIQSSWEFANYIFKIDGVSRAFTHQLVRTRNASYAQESQRTVDVRAAGYTSTQDDFLDSIITGSIDMYADAIDRGIQVQNARGVLPTNMHTRIIIGCNLRTLSHMAELRLCKRAQGEYQEVFKAMKAVVIKVHPWADEFIQVHCVKTGLCAFPNYSECPVQAYAHAIPSSHKSLIRAHWEREQHVANPIAKNGKTMR